MCYNLKDKQNISTNVDSRINLQTTESKVSIFSRCKSLC